MVGRYIMKNVQQVSYFLIILPSTSKTKMIYTQLKVSRHIYIYIYINLALFGGKEKNVSSSILQT